MNKKNYWSILLLGNLLTLSISFILTRLLSMPFKWWNVIAITTSSYVVHHYLENKKKSSTLIHILAALFPINYKRASRPACSFVEYYLLILLLRRVLKPCSS